MLKLAWKNIWHRPLNLLLTLILFSLGVGLTIYLLLVNQQVKENFDKNLAGVDLVIGAKGSPLQLILCNMYHIDNPTGNISVKEATPFLRPNHPLIKDAIPLSLGDNYRGFRIVGTVPDILPFYEAKISNGIMWQHSSEVVIGAQVALRAGLKIGDRFVTAHGFEDDPDFNHDHQLEVVGILSPTGSVIDQLILTSYKTVWDVHDHVAPDSINAEAVHDHDAHDHSSHDHELTNEDLIQNVDKDITGILIRYKSRTNFQSLNLARNINENTDLQAASPAIEINRLYSMLGIATNILKYLAVLIAAVSGISIFLALLRGLKERKYELALMRVLGGSKRTLFLLILLEGLILAALGALIGILLGHIATAITANLVTEEYAYTLNPWVWLKQEWYVLAASLTLGILAALIPAWLAYRVDIHETLQGR